MYLPNYAIPSFLILLLLHFPIPTATFLFSFDWNCFGTESYNWQPCVNETATFGQIMAQTPGILLCNAPDFDDLWNWTTQRCASPPPTESDCIDIYSSSPALADKHGSPGVTKCNYYNAESNINDWNNRPYGFCKNIPEMRLLEGDTVVRYMRPLGARCEVFTEMNCVNTSSFRNVTDTGSGVGYGGYSSEVGWGLKSIRCQECENCTSEKSAADTGTVELADGVVEGSAARIGSSEVALAVLVVFGMLFL